jgi:CHAT domain-containing protein
MRQALTNRLVESTALAEAAQQFDTLLRSRDPFLSVTAHTRTGAESVYARIWPGRSVLTRLLERRHQSFQAMTEKPEVRRRWEELTDVSRQLTRLLLHPPGSTKDLDERARTLTARKERLERELAPLLPALAAQKELDRLGPADLQRQLPAHTAFVDILRYTRTEQDLMVPGKKGEKLTAHCLAFVLTRERITRVELGEAAAIEAPLARWRQAIQERRDDPADDELRRRVWEPVARHLPADTETVYHAPDGALTRLPWAALPGEQPGTVLLERYTVAVVPHGRHLLARLRGPKQQDFAGALLVVGGVDYDAKPAAADSPPGRGFAATDVPDRAGTPGKWPHLPATTKELQRLGGVPGLTVRAVTRTEASTARLFQELPRARLAHLATHGFFAQRALEEERQRADRQLENWEFNLNRTTPEIGLGRRNPLAYAGLVLAGANKPEEAGPDGGILTGETLIHLPLERLELAVLSACQTGLGSVADGQCVHSLQLAFHVAGCQNVVASLWDVPDEATAALMALFYDELLREHKPPLDALRRAQLTVYRNPGRIKELAERGAERPKAKASDVPAPAAAPGPRAPVKDWAGFVLSGLGQ